MRRQDVKVFDAVLIGLRFFDRTHDLSQKEQRRSKALVPRPLS